MESQLVAYIQKSLRVGRTLAQIRQDLLAAGVQAQLVEQSLAIFQPDRQPEVHQETVAVQPAMVTQPKETLFTKIVALFLVLSGFLSMIGGVGLLVTTWFLGNREIASAYYLALRLTASITAVLLLAFGYLLNKLSAGIHQLQEEAWKCARLVFGVGCFYALVSIFLPFNQLGISIGALILNGGLLLMLMRDAGLYRQPAKTSLKIPLLLVLGLVLVLNIVNMFLNQLVLKKQEEQLVEYLQEDYEFRPSANQSGMASTGESGWESYTNSDYQVAFDYPADLSIEEFAETSWYWTIAFAERSNLTLGSHYWDMYLRIIPVSNDFYLNQFESNLQQATQNQPGYVLTDLGGEEAVMTDQKMIQCLHGEHIFELTLWQDFDERFQIKLADSARQVQTSFRFLD